MVEEKFVEVEQIPAVPRLIRRFDTMQGVTAVDQGEVATSIGGTVYPNRNGICLPLQKTNPEFLKVWQKVISDSKFRQQKVDYRRGGL